LELIQRDRLDEISNDSTSTIPTPPRCKRNPRSRNRSRGYHSFSSDDVASDGVTDLGYDFYIDMEYVNTNDMLDAGRKDVRNQPCQTKLNQLKRSNTFPERELRKSSSYLNMTATEKSQCHPIRVFTQSQSNTENASLLRPGQVPYENITYCSKLYGNVPDALVCLQHPKQ